MALVPQPRSTVLAIPAYVAGKPPVARDGLTSYKLSSNENPYPPLPGVLEAATEAAAQMNRYPDMGSTALYAALGEAMGVPVERPGRGDRLGRPDLPAGQRVLRPRRRGRLCLALLRGVPDRRHRRRRDQRAGAADRATAATTSTRWRRRSPTVRRSSSSARPTTRPARPSPSPTSTPSSRRSPRTSSSWSTRPTSSSSGWTTRSTASRPTAATTTSCSPAPSPRRTGWPASGSATPSAPAPIAGALRAVSLPFGVSHVAQAAAIASLAARDELFARVEDLVERRADLVARLREVGWELPDAQGNFVWFPLGDRALDFAAACGELGISVRPVRRRRRTRQHRRGRGLRPGRRGGRPLHTLRLRRAVCEGHSRARNPLHAPPTRAPASTRGCGGA